MVNIGTGLSTQTAGGGGQAQTTDNTSTPRLFGTHVEGIVITSVSQAALSEVDAYV